MTFFKFSVRNLLFLSITLLASSTFAGFWEWSTPYQGPKRDISTLMLTSNYATPVMIAQLIQHENRQPFILLPKQGDSKIFFWPAGQKNLALEVREKNLARFIKFINPKQVIVLGDKKFVAQKYLDMIDKNIPTVVIKSDNWQKNAMTLQKLLKLNTLARDFKRLNNEKQAGLYQPTKSKSPVAQTEIIKQEEEVVKIDTEKQQEEIVVKVDALTVEDKAPVITPIKTTDDSISEPEIKAPPKVSPVLIEE